MARRFDVFLSHNSKNKPVVRDLAQKLKARGIKVWLDEWELIAGRPWQDALEEIIQTAAQPKGRLPDRESQYIAR